MSERVIQPELLDDSDPAEAPHSLADLRRLNRSFGGYEVLRRMLRKVVPEGSSDSLLDVGCASGDNAQIIRQAYPKMKILGIDYNATNLAQAQIPKALGNAFQLPVRDHSVDYVFCALFLHHFTNDQVTSLLRTFYAICRKAVLISDLERNVIAERFVPATAWLFRWHPITCHDAPVSVRAGFSRIDLERLAANAGLPEPIIERHFPAFRYSLIAHKDGART